MVRPYLRGRRRYILVHWEPSQGLDKGSLIALVRQQLNPLTRRLESSEQGKGRTAIKAASEHNAGGEDQSQSQSQTKGKSIGKGKSRGKGKSTGMEQRAPQGQVRGLPVRSGLVRFDPPWAAVVVDHRLQQTATRELNTLWQGVELETVATSGTLQALWRRTGRPTPPRDR